MILNATCVWVNDRSKTKSKIRFYKSILFLKQKALEKYFKSVFD